MNLGLLVLRIIVGLYFVGHGAQKLFGVAGGYGLAGTGQFFESMDMRPGRLNAFAAGAQNASMATSARNTRRSLMTAPCARGARTAG